MRTVHYTADAARDLRRYGNTAGRIRKTVAEHAADPNAHANNVTQLVGSSAFRMRVGDFRVIFEATDAKITVTRIAPRGSVYE